MGFFRKNKKKDVDIKGQQDEGAVAPKTRTIEQNVKPAPVEMEANAMPAFPDEKIAVTSKDDGNMTASSTHDESTISTMSSYRGPPSHSQYQPSSSTRSTPFSGTGSSSDFGPDINPVTRQMMTPDDGMEVVVQKGSMASPSLSTRLQASKSYREYNFYYTNALTHLVICDPEQTALFFAEVSPFAKGMPDVQLRDILAGGFDNLASKGPSLGLKEAQDVPVVAVADQMPNSKHIKLGLGDPLHPETTTWIVMRNTHDDPKNNLEKYEMTAANSNGQQMVYQWISGAAGDKDADESTASSSSRRDSRSQSHSKEAFKLISEHGLVASFRNASITSVKKRGALRLYETAGSDEILPLIFLGCSALCERQRRRKVKKGLFMGMGGSKKS